MNDKDTSEQAAGIVTWRVQQTSSSWSVLAVHVDQKFGRSRKRSRSTMVTELSLGSCDKVVVLLPPDVQQDR